MRKTKIVCTIGPKSQDVKTITKMAEAGMSVARFNFSHGSHEEHKARMDVVKAVREKLDKPMGLMLDTKGPEIRIKTFKDEAVFLEEGQRFDLVTYDIEGDAERVSITYKPLPKEIKTGNRILINDGLIELEVVNIRPDTIECVVLVGGELRNRKSINIPGVAIDMPYLSQADIDDIKFGISQDVDFIAASFVRCAGDVAQVRKLLRDNGGHEIDIIAKIENRQGVDNILEIIDAADGIMVARGDMGVELPFELLPKLQKDIIKKCYSAGKRVITATQMLESMCVSPRPTRAEVSDVANAVYDGTSATMLSGETASGKYPVQSVATMAAIALETENGIHYKKRFKNLALEVSDIPSAIASSTVASAHDLDAKAIIVITTTGSTARRVSSFRPIVPIFAITTSRKGYNKLAMSWGVTPILAPKQKDTDSWFKEAIDRVKATKFIKKGDLVVLTAGVPIEEPGTTNIMKIAKVD